MQLRGGNCPPLASEWANRGILKGQSKEDTNLRMGQGTGSITASCAANNWELQDSIMLRNWCLQSKKRAQGLVK